MDVFEAITRRRTIKPEHLSPAPLERGWIERVLEAANWAPSHGHTEPWRFIVFEGAAREALAGAVLDTMVGDGDPPITETDPRRTSLYAKMLRAPVIIAIICAPSAGPKIVEQEEIIATGIAVQNLHLAAVSLGLAGSWTSGKKCTHPKMARFLDIAPPAQCLGFFYLGWPAQAAPEGARRPIAEKVSWRT
ncbi:MAG: nitroreductase [Deltaproteobacteria bacterium]|nr:nitroreductase [Deltaproteobacteria bacterium]